MVEKIKEALERAYRERIGEKELGALDNASTPDRPRENRPDRKKSKADRKTLKFDSKSDQKLEISSPGILESARPFEVNTKLMSNNRVITLDNSHNEVESYRLLRTQLVSMSKSGRMATIGITSSNASEGKTLTSINLAISLAKTADMNVVLVDGDISHPSIHGRLGMVNPAGLLDFLTGKVELSEILWKLNIPNLWFVSGRYERVSMLDHALSGRIGSMLESLSASPNTLVLVDLPPVLAKDDTLALAEHLDGVILVVEEGGTRSTELSRSVELLRECNVIGSVLNKFSRKQTSYY